MSQEYTLEAIEALHRKYAPSKEVYDLVFTHCQAVYDIAQQLMANGTFTVDADLVRVGCLLHDIGVYPLFGADGKLRQGVHYITHGTEGEAILKNEGFPEVIWRFASHHTGVGLSRQDVIDQHLPMPAVDYLDETTEEALVMYADKFHSKSTPPHFNKFESYKQHVAQFGPDKEKKLERMARQFGMPDLVPLSKKYGYIIK